MGIRYEILWNSLLLFSEFFWRYVRNSLLLFGESFSMYVRDVKAKAATPADMEENLNSYLFVMDMPGLRFVDIKKNGKIHAQVSLTDNANTDTDVISVLYQDGVLTVTVNKLPAQEVEAY
ncbi:hypothetical protein V8G54_008500 [Vigna mungo]|uniref:SHSP domain-containing protein n=1 Tax=Vigna mungo TaxID=3915 RepID=A0AAQ3P4C5_VIGMU